MSSGPLETIPQAGDFVIQKESAEYCLISLPVVNEGAVAVDLDYIAGMPVIIDANQTKASLVEVGLLNYDEGDVNGFLVEGPKEKGLASSGTTQVEYSVIWAAPATLNQDKIPATDSAGNAITVATVVAAAKANMKNNPKFVTEAALQSEQTADGNTAI